MRFGIRLSRKVLIGTVAIATILSLIFEGSLTKSFIDRRLSVNLGGGQCEYKGALQHYDAGFPTDAKLHKTIIAGYPSGDKRLTFSQLEGHTGLSARDEWDFKFLGMTNQPFIKANYPHHEGTWGWGDVGDQVILVVSELKRVLVEYHDILWDIGYAQTFEEAYERIENLYKEEPHNPDVGDFLIWRDLRVFDEIHWYSWFIDYYMEGGLMRDMFTHEMTVPPQWQMSILPNFFSKHEARHGRFVAEGQTIEPSYDPMCATLSKGCYPVMLLDPDKLVDHDYGADEARKLALAVNGTEGFDDWLIDEEAWECVWKELIIEGKGIRTFLDRIDTLDYEQYKFSYEMKNEMYSEINRLIEKYDRGADEISIELVKILKGHRDALGIIPTDSLSYEDLMGYHLKFPPFFPNQKTFTSDDDFFVNQMDQFGNQYTLVSENLKCPEEGAGFLSRSTGLLTRAQCLKKCSDTVGCQYFSLEENPDQEGGICITCSAASTLLEVSGFTSYTMNEPPTAESVIDKRRTWFQEQMESKRSRDISIKYYDATGWKRLPVGGLSSLTPYASDNAYSINFRAGDGNFAGSGRRDGVGALFEGNLYVDGTVSEICVTSDDGSKLYIDDVLLISNDGTHAPIKKCAPIASRHAVYKFELEFFEAGGGATCVVKWGTNPSNHRVIPPRAWASTELARGHRQLMMLNEFLEEDLRNLKETGFMVPTTRAEYNFRKNQEESKEERMLRKSNPEFDFSNFDNILKQRKSDQLKLAKSLFGGN